jgi:cyclopropane fatty-acyl-phospholipid synthase-like methyltransferase
MRNRRKKWKAFFKKAANSLKAAGKVIMHCHNAYLLIKEYYPDLEPFIKEIVRQALE